MALQAKVLMRVILNVKEHMFNYFIFRHLIGLMVKSVKLNKLFSSTVLSKCVKICVVLINALIPPYITPVGKIWFKNSEADCFLDLFDIFEGILLITIPQLKNP